MPYKLSATLRAHTSDVGQVPIPNVFFHMKLIRSSMLRFVLLALQRTSSSFLLQGIQPLFLGKGRLYHCLPLSLQKLS